jgi:hypothetical protein
MVYHSKLLVGSDRQDTMIYQILLSVYRPHSFAQRARRKFASVFGWPKLSVPTPQELIQKYAPGKTFADIGCMWGINGANSFFAERCGAKRVMAVDVYPATDQFTAEHSRSNSHVEFLMGDINQSDTLRQIGTVDVVFCSGVLYHMPDPWTLLVSLRSICGNVLLLYSQLIPEIPGLRNTAIFYPMLNEARRKPFKLGIGMQKAITGPYEPESGYGNWFWGLTPSCVESMLSCAGFMMLEKHVEPFAGWFVCSTTDRKFGSVSGEYVSRDDPRFTRHLAV